MPNNNFAFVRLNILAWLQLSLSHFVSCVTSLIESLLSDFIHNVMVLYCTKVQVHKSSAVCRWSLIEERHFWKVFTLQITILWQIEFHLSLDIGWNRAMVNNPVRLNNELDELLSLSSIAVFWHFLKAKFPELPNSYLDSKKNLKMRDWWIRWRSFKKTWKILI